MTHEKSSYAFFGAQSGDAALPTVDIVWYKRDLRIHDHAAFLGALGALGTAVSGGDATAPTVNSTTAVPSALSTAASVSLQIQQNNLPLGLTQNCSQQHYILVLYILEPQLWSQPDMSYRHYLFLEQCLGDLSRELRVRLGIPTPSGCGGTGLAIHHRFQRLMMWLRPGASVFHPPPTRS